MRYQHLSTWAYGVQPSVCKYECMPWTHSCICSQGPPKGARKCARSYIRGTMNRYNMTQSTKWLMPDKFFCCLGPARHPQKPHFKIWPRYTFEVPSQTSFKWTGTSHWAWNSSCQTNYLLHRACQMPPKSGPLDTPTPKYWPYIRVNEIFEFDTCSDLCFTVWVTTPK